MNILYTLNDKFVPQVAAGITSICENNKDVDNIVFYLMSLNISDENKKKLKKYIKKYKNRSIEIIELNDMKDHFSFEFDTSGWNPIVLARLLLDKLLPKDIDRVLYLDGDTIVRGSLKELYELDLDNYSIAASVEPTVSKKIKRNLGLEKYPYYNAGVLLVNMKHWRKNKTGSKIIEYYKEHNGKLFANDQDAINGSVNDYILTISPKYNFCNIYYQYSYKYMKKLMKPVPYITEEEYKDAVKNPVIVHYLGEERPWRKGNKHRYRNDYTKYLDMTPWKGQNYEEGWEMYFKAYSTFMFVTKPVQGVRHKIMDVLIPVFLNHRSKQLKKSKKKEGK